MSWWNAAHFVVVFDDDYGVFLTFSGFSMCTISLLFIPGNTFFGTLPINAA